MSDSIAVDPFDRRVALRADGLLEQFNGAGVLGAADVHVARRLGALGEEPDEAVLLAAALAVRAPRLGHVHVDLATINATAAVDGEELIDLAGLPWPDPGEWKQRVMASSLLATGDEQLEPRPPLCLEGSRLYLARYWAEEVQIADDLCALGTAPPDDVDEVQLAARVARVFPDQTDGRQAEAATTAVRQRLAIVAGGPGTGKTTTVARILALLLEQAQAVGDQQPLIALAAPTGKAAARLQEAVREEATGLAVAADVREVLASLEGLTLHRLLGWRPDSSSRFRHHRGDRLPHDVIVVDETSMVSLTQMARLLEAVRPTARLVLVGDPEQLRSVEAGAVLGDIVGPASGESAAPAGAPLLDNIVVLDRVYRHGGGIAEVASAIRTGDPDAVVKALQADTDDVTWVEAAAAHPTADELILVRERAVSAAIAVHEAAHAGRSKEALQRLGALRVLCAHRRGPDGVARWNDTIEGWLRKTDPTIETARRWYVGQPLLVTQNDYELRLYNGDAGVVVQEDGDHITAVFDRGQETVRFSPTRLGAVETVFAMTIHKSQGSQFETAVVLLPPPESRILTRELLYTAATRARKELIVVGTEDAVRAAAERPVARASGLGDRLWP